MNASPLQSGPTVKLLTFRISDQEYAIDALSVDQVLVPPAVTPLPHSPAYVLGVVTQRGQVIPVIDLRRRLGYPACEPTRDTCMIAVRTKEVSAGLLVDRVTGFLGVDPQHIVAPPRIEHETRSPFVGIVTPDSKGKTLIDLGRLLTP